MFSEVSTPYNTLNSQLYAGYCAACQHNRSNDPWEYGDDPWDDRYYSGYAPWDDDYYDLFNYRGGRAKRRHTKKRGRARKRQTKMTKATWKKILRAIHRHR